MVIKTYHMFRNILVYNKKKEYKRWSGTTLQTAYTCFYCISAYNYNSCIIAVWLGRSSTLLGEFSDVTADWMGYPLDCNDY